MASLHILELCSHLCGVLTGTLLTQAGQRVSKATLGTHAPTAIDHGKAVIDAAAAARMVGDAGAVDVVLTDLSDSELRSLGCHPEQLAPCVLGATPLLFVRIVPSLLNPSLHWDAVGTSVGQDHDAFVGAYLHCTYDNAAALVSGQVAAWVLFTHGSGVTGVHTVAVDDVLTQATAVVSTKHDAVKAFLAGATKSASPAPFTAFFRVFVDSYACADGRHVMICMLSPASIARFFGVLGIDAAAHPMGPDFHPAKIQPLVDALSAAFLRQPSAHWEQALQAVNVACVTNKTVDEISNADGVGLRTAHGGIGSMVNVRRAAPAAADAGALPADIAGTEPFARSVIDDLCRLAGQRSSPVPGLPLAGALVLDISHTVAGPFCGRCLSEFGATVVKIDPLGLNYVFRGEELLRGKLSLKLDLRTAAGRGVFARLVRSADFLVDSFRPDALDRLGFGEARLAELNPRLICARMKLHESGPLKGYVGYAPVGMAVSGQTLSHQRRTGFERPLLHYFQSVDVVCGQLALVGCAAAHRERAAAAAAGVAPTGGWFLTASLLRGAALCLVSEYFPDAAVYRRETAQCVCRDGAVLLVGAGCGAAKAALGAAAAEMSVAEVQAAVAGKVEATEPCAMFHRKIWSEPVLARGVRWISTTENCGGPMPLQARFLPLPKTAPAPGSDTAAVLGALGFTGSDLAQFAKDGVIDVRDLSAISLVFPQ